MAKEIIETERCLVVPEVKAEFRGASKLIYNRQKVHFDLICIEAQHLPNLVPDLYVECGDRPLLIEIYVTHACDELKLNSLLKLDIAAVEIDLSRFPRDAPRSAVRDAVIEHSNRKWLFHPKIKEARDEFHKVHLAKEDARQRKFDEEVSALLLRYEEGVRSLADRKARPRDETNEFFRIGLGSHIGCSVGGSGGFLVTEEEWQFLVLRSFISKGDGRPTYRHHAIFERLKGRKLIRTGFQYIKPELEVAMRERNGHFLSPYRAVEAYLNELVARGVLRKVDTYYLSTKVHEKLLDLRGSIERKNRRRAELIERVDRIIAGLPKEESAAFSTAAWLALRQANGQSFIDAIESDDEVFEQMLVPLRRIESLMFRKGAAFTDNLGLPIVAFQERELNTRRVEQASREAEEREKAAVREEALQKAAEERGRKLKSEAESCGNRWPTWIETANPDLNGMTPLAAVISGGEQMPRAQRLFELGLEEEARQRAKIEEEFGWKQELQRQVQDILGPAAAPFLVSPYSLEPGGKKSSPRDYCVSRFTLEECVALAKKVQKSRR